MEALAMLNPTPLYSFAIPILIPSLVTSRHSSAITCKMRVLGDFAYMLCGELVLLCGAIIRVHTASRGYDVAHARAPLMPPANAGIARARALLLLVVADAERDGDSVLLVTFSS